MKLIGLTLASALSGVVIWVTRPVPPTLLAPPVEQSLVLTDRHGLPLRTTRGAEGARVSWVPLSDMDPDLPRAFIAAEDQRFLSHPGVDLRAAVRAVRDNLDRGQVVSGASTITMQLARLLLPIDRGYLGKLRQAMWARDSGWPLKEESWSNTGCRWGGRSACRSPCDSTSTAGGTGESRSGCPGTGALALQPESAGVPRAGERSSRGGAGCSCQAGVHHFRRGRPGRSRAGTRCGSGGAIPRASLHGQAPRHRRERGPSPDGNVADVARPRFAGMAGRGGQAHHDPAC
jgi:hypothetical protein